VTDFIFYVPGSRHYDNEFYVNKPSSFANISISGTECACLCDHCGGQLLRNMLAAPTPKALVQVAEKLCREGCRGVLISGGACCDGSVPLVPFGAALQELVNMGLSVIIHPGLLDEKTASVLAEAKVSGVALDLIGDAETIRKVYHLERTPEHYLRSLRTARKAGLRAMPHIVAGLHYGELRGEYAAIDMVAAEGASCLIFVVLQPLAGTKMQAVTPPAPLEIKNLFTVAREKLPDLPLMLGCARPPGNYARAVELLAADAGFAAIAYPADETVSYVRSLGYQIAYRESCCGT
jgi:lipoyl synthase